MGMWNEMAAWYAAQAERNVEHGRPRASSSGFRAELDFEAVEREALELLERLLARGEVEIPRAVERARNATALESARSARGRRRRRCVRMR